MSRFDDDDGLHALIDSEVEPDLRAELEALLRGDPANQERMEEYQRNKAALKAAANAQMAGAPSASLKTEGLTRTLRAALYRSAILRALPRIAAAFVLIAIGAGGHALYAMRQAALEPTYAFQTSDTRLVLDAENLQTSRRLAVTSAGEISREAERWLGRAVSPPRLSRQGLALVDARLMQSDDRKLVGLIYEDPEGRRLTLSISADLDGERDALKTVDIESGRADYWSDGRGSYVLVDERVRPLGTDSGLSVGG